jgi:hypothetical protein
MAPSQLALASQCTSASQAASASRFASANRFILTRQFALATRSRGPRFSSRATQSRSMLGDAHRSRRFRHDRLSERSFSSRCQISRTRFPSHRPGLRSGIVCSTDEPRASMSSSQRDDRDTTTIETLMIPAGGARRDRTDDLLLAKQALSQLSYGPGPERTHPTDRNPGRGRAWWAWEDLNFRPHAYQARALTN